MEYHFKLLVDFGEHKKSKVFDCFDGLVCGVYSKELDEKIYFTNPYFFKIITKKPKVKIS